MSRERLDLLPVVKLLLSLFLVDLQPLEFLALARAARGRLDAALLLQHTQLCRTLLLLTHYLMLLKRARSRVFRGACQVCT